MLCLRYACLHPMHLMGANPPLPLKPKDVSDVHSCTNDLIVHMICPYVDFICKMWNVFDSSLPWLGLYSTTIQDILRRLLPTFPGNTIAPSVGHTRVMQSGQNQDVSSGLNPLSHCPFGKLFGIHVFFLLKFCVQTLDFKLHLSINLFKYFYFCFLCAEPSKLIPLC